MNARAILFIMSFAVCPITEAATLVYDDFEVGTNTVGPLNGQSSNGPFPWTSSGAVVVNTGPTVGGQAVNYTSTLAPGIFDHHSWVNLSGTGGFPIPVGYTLRASVDVYNDPNHPEVWTGLAMWGNSHGGEESLVGMSGIGWRMARHGLGPNAPLPGNIANPPDTGWHNIALLVKQIDANTLVTTYEIDGQAFTWNGFTYNTHTGIGFPTNYVSDFSLVTMNFGSSTASITGIYDNYNVQLVPEPATLATFAIALLGLRRKRLRA